MTRHQHVNSGWASGFSNLKVPAAGVSEFERYARRLGLAEHEYAQSAEFRRWCYDNRNRCYIPEWLLAEWGIEVDPEMSDRK